MLITFRHTVLKLKKLADKRFRDLSDSEVKESILAISDIIHLEKESTRHQALGTSYRQAATQATNPWFNNRDFEKRLITEYRKIFDENTELKEVLKRLMESMELTGISKKNIDFNGGYEFFS